MNSIAELADVLQIKLDRERKLYQEACKVLGPFDSSLDTEDEIRSKTTKADFHRTRIDCLSEVLIDLNAAAIHRFVDHEAVADSAPPQVAPNILAKCTCADESTYTDQTCPYHSQNLQPGSASRRKGDG